MTPKEIEFWKRQRALLIEQEKALTELRASTIGQRKAIENLLSEPLPIDIRPLEPHTPLDNETTAPRITYTTI